MVLYLVVETREMRFDVDGRGISWRLNLRDFYHQNIED